MTRPERRTRIRLAVACAVLALAAATVAVVGPARVTGVATSALDAVAAPFRSGDEIPDVAAPTPPPGPFDDESGAPSTDPASAQRQAALVTAEDERINRIVAEPPETPAPYDVAGGPQTLPTTVLTARPRPYDLPSLQRLDAAEQLPDGTWLLRNSIVVGKDAELRIDAPGTTVRLASGPAGFASIIAAKGTLRLAGAPGAPLTLTSWTAETQAPDTVAADGRAYVRAAGGRMELDQAVTSDLGFWSGRTGGVAWTGSSTTPSTGSATGTLTERGHYGMFVSRAANLLLAESTIRDSELDGLLVQRQAGGVATRNLTVESSGRNGVLITRGATNVSQFDPTVRGNVEDGIRIDGTPVSERASAGGASTARSGTFVVEGATATDNGGAGVLATSADDVRITGATVTGGRSGIVARGPARNLQVEGSTVDVPGYAVSVRGGVTDARLTGNTVRAARTGIHVVDSTAVASGNTVTASRYGLSLVGDVTGSAATDNRLDGRGLAAVDLNRLRPGAIANVSGNDERGWVVDRDDLRYWASYIGNHPVLLLWIGLIALLGAVRLWTMRRRRRQLIHPYQNVNPGPPAAEPMQHKPYTAGLLGTVDLPPAAAGPKERPGAPGGSPGKGAVRPERETAVMPITRVTVVSGGRQAR